MQKKNFSVIGKPLRKIDAMAKCAGETLYADELNLPRMIYARLLRSPHPHARILSINTARALKLHGVFAVITGEEMPEKFGIMPSILLLQSRPQVKRWRTRRSATLMLNMKC